MRYPPRRLNGLTRKWCAALFSLAVGTGACAHENENSNDDDDDLDSVEQAVVAASISPSADTRLLSASPASNAGTSSDLVVSSLSATGKASSLIKFAQSDIVSRTGTNKVYKAWIELQIKNLPQGWIDGSIAVHRMTRDWAESSATWACAADSSPTNATNNCTPANTWNMGDGVTPFASVPSASARLYSTQGNAKLMLDVTADVQAFLAGSPNHGWIIRGIGTDTSGAAVTFHSRQGSTPPKLMLDVGADLCPDDSKVAPGQCGCGIPDVDSDGDGIANCFEPALTPVADTALGGVNINANNGTLAGLRTTSVSTVGLERSLVRFDQAQIVAATAGKEITSATVELTVTDIALGWNGGLIEIAAMNRSWQEGSGTDTSVKRPGATWACAADRDTSALNFTQDCSSADRWGMTSPSEGPMAFVAAATSTAPIYTGVTKVVRFDVTSDVQKFLAGTMANNGWIIKGRDALTSAKWIVWGSRESTVPPRLVLNVGPIARCGDEYACTISRQVNRDAYVRAAQSLANFGADTKLLAGNDPQANHALVGFSLPDVMGGASKESKIKSAKLIVKNLGGGSGPGTMAAHRMLRDWAEQGATWGCANDSNTSTIAQTCAASDVWSLAGAGAPYETAFSSASTSLNTASEVSFDVTAAFVRALKDDAPSVSWFIRLTSGTGTIRLGSREGNAAARLVVEVEDDAGDATAKRDEDLAEEAAQITDPVAEGYDWWLAWASICSTSRAISGTATLPLEDTFVKISTKFNAKQRSYVQRIATDLRDIPAATATALLGPFAQIDPRSCQSAPAYETAGAILKSRTRSARMRTEFCANPDGSVTVEAEETREPDVHPDNGHLPGTGILSAKGRPIITGVAMVSTLEAPDRGHPTLIDDWSTKRIGPGGRDDGLSPWGVVTNISCSGNVTYANDTCNHSMGLICSNLVGRDNNKCVAFPIVYEGEALVLRGHNFWDDEAVAKLDNQNDPLLSGSPEVSSIRVNPQGTPAVDCTPAANPFSNPSLVARGLNNHEIAEFPIDVPAGFYSVTMYNKNGAYRTQEDALLGRPGRTIHVCEAPDPSRVPFYRDGTEGTNRDCTPPSESCVQDGAACTAQWNTPPRPLKDANGNYLSDCAHAAGTLPRCGETPMFFESTSLLGNLKPYIFVLAERPIFEVRTYLNRVECTEETGCNNCGGEDAFEFLFINYTQAAIKAGQADPANLIDIDKMFKVYSDDFEHRQIRHPGTLLSRIPNVTRSDMLYTAIVYAENDDFEEIATYVVGAIITGASAYGATYIPKVGIGVAAGVGGAGGLLTYAIAESIKGLDVLGGTSWEGNYWDHAKLTEISHQPDFLTRQMSQVQRPLPPSGKSVGSLDARVLHPVVGYGRDDNAVPMCGPGATAVCSGSEVCYVNWCFSNFVDGPTSDPIFGIGYRTRYGIDNRSARNGDDGFYKADIETVFCAPGSPSPRCQ